MFNRCPSCSIKDYVRDFLLSDSESSSTRIVKYMQWEKSIGEKGVQRISLVDISEPFLLVVESLIDDLLGRPKTTSMTKRHFIANQQSSYYARCQEHAEKDTGVITADYAKNYAFIAQNSTQGFYFYNSHATLFTAIFYYKDQNRDTVKNKSFCVISDTDKHYAYSVHAFLEPIIKKIKAKYSWVKKIKLFSDNAPQQFKNK